MSLPTPPRYVILPQEVIEQAFAPDKPRRALLASFTRILSLAWHENYEKTPPMDEEELIEFLKVSRRQYFEQKADMELMQWLRSSHPRPGFVQFTFSRSVSEKTALDASAKNPTPVRESAPLVVVRESLESSNPESPTTELNGNASAENRTGLPTVPEILAQTPLLFDGAMVTGSGLEDRNPLHVLAWCAYAFSQKSKLTGPGGLVRKRLLENQRPPDWTMEQWPSELPESFLEALSLIKFQCDRCEQKFDKRAELESHIQDVHPVICDQCGEKCADEIALAEHNAKLHAPQEMIPDESVTARIDGRMSAQQAWESVLGQLQMEMPRASFDSWVRDTKAVRYGGNTLAIGVRNAYARDWLESRLASTVSRLLVGILRKSVEVEFVTE